MGKNNKFLKEVKEGTKVESYSIKKFKVGAVSVVVGLVSFQVQGQQLKHQKTFLTTQLQTTQQMQKKKLQNQQLNQKQKTLKKVQQQQQRQKQEQKRLKQKLNQIDLDQKNTLTKFQLIQMLENMLIKQMILQQY